MTTAVILATGPGAGGLVRLGAEPVVAESIRKLQAVGMRRIVLLTRPGEDGYREVAASFAGAVEAVAVPESSGSGPLHVLGGLGPDFDEDYLLLGSGLVYERRALPACLEAPEPDVLVVASPAGSASAVQFVGIAKVSRRLHRILVGMAADPARAPGPPRLQDAAEGLVAASRDSPIRVLPIPALLWADLDEPGQFLRARDAIYPAIEAADRPEPVPGGTSRPGFTAALLWAEDRLQAFLARGAELWTAARVRLRQPTTEGQRGRSCHCPPAPLHLVHSEGLREACDFVLDYGSNVTHPGRPQVPVESLREAARGLPPGAAVHVKTCLLADFTHHLLPEFPGQVVLVTGDSDASPFPAHRLLLEHPKIRHWFAQNWADAGVHPKLTRLPIGFDNPVYTKLEKRLGFLLAMLRGRMPLDPTASRNDIGDQARIQQIRAGLLRPTRERAPRALCTFHQNQKLIAPDLQRFPERQDAWQVLHPRPWCHFVTRRVPQHECWRIHEDFAFEVSPRGNGLDCFRTWEALFLGTIPIVKASPLDRLYRDLDLPVVIVETWDEITQERLLDWRERLAGRFDAALTGKLTNDHWVARIREVAGPRDRTGGSG